MVRRYGAGRGTDTAAYAAESWSSTINPNPLFDTALPGAGLAAGRDRSTIAVIVALAAKLAQVAWATLRKGVSFERQPELARA
ncbi:hypothetical protein [Methylobacterium mesophilicum]